VFLLALAVVLGLAAGPAAAAGPTNDPESANQWGLTDIKAPETWPKGKGGGVNVAVVSTGIAKHPDLTAKTDGGFDAIGTDPTNDTGGRGTHLAGIVGAATNNSVGIAGVAPDARLLPYRAFESDTAVGSEGHLKALQRVIDTRPQVALVDLPDSLPAAAKDRLRQSFKILGDAGISVVVGAQNGIGLNDLPILAVAATTSKGDQAPGTPGVGDRGVAAPGQGITSTTVDSPLLGGVYGYGEQSGTGQAAAHVAGAVAILRGLGATSNQAADLLRSTARKNPSASLGAGLIDVAAAAAAYRPQAVTPATTTTTTKKAAAKTAPTKPPTGLGAIPTGPAVPPGPTGPTDPAFAGEPVEPGAGETPVTPPGSEALAAAETGRPSATAGGDDDRPLGLLSVGFGLLFGVGTGLSLTFRRLAAAPL